MGKIKEEPPLITRGKKVQKFLVDSALFKAKELLTEYCEHNMNSISYAGFIFQHIMNNVLEIPNIQIWVEDDYLTNSTQMCLMEVARHPYTYTVQPADYSVPNDNKHFGNNVMGSVSDAIYYGRALAEYTNIIHRLLGYYPTHTVEIEDFSFAMINVWERARAVLLRGVPEHQKRFFTHHLLNQFIMSLAYDKDDYPPNIKLAFYDCIGTQTQCVMWNYNTFKDRFNPGCDFKCHVSYDAYDGFIFDILGPIRSIKSVRGNCALPTIEFRQASNITKEEFKNVQGIMSDKVLRNAKALKEMFLTAMTGDMELLKEVVKVQTNSEKTRARIGRIAEKYETFLLRDMTNDFGFPANNIKQIERKGGVFTTYEHNIDLLKYGKNFSEVILNMKDFEREYPSMSEQQFSEVYLMAQTINMVRRSFVKNFKRDDWDLVVRIIPNGEFTFNTVVEELNKQLHSQYMDNFVTRIG